jgi:hypothetical protein
VLAPKAPAIDGRDDDEVWRLAAPIKEFLEFEPNEGKAPRFATEARVAYDARNFYVFVRAFDPEPDRVLKLLARRDIRTASDQIKIIIDSYHDRRSGYEFAVNPAGVKRDYSVFNDGNEDDAWDGVWETSTATRSGSAGRSTSATWPGSPPSWAKCPDSPGSPRPGGWSSRPIWSPRT